MDIHALFAVTAEEKGYRRLDPSYKVDTFIGVTDEGQLSVAIIEQGKIVKVTSSKLINVGLMKTKDNKQQMVFSLQDDSYAPLFFQFCEDLIDACESAGKAKAIEAAAGRWNNWRNLFGKKRGDLLDKNEVRGLIGELLVLRDQFIPAYGADTAVNSWMGPLMGHKDFEIGNTWYEVKTAPSSAIQVTISSLEQLDADVDGHLAVVRLDDASTVTDTVVTLNKLVQNVRELISNASTLGLFHERLDSVGYEMREEYDAYPCKYIGREYYLITEGFPRIRRSDVAMGIGNVKYTIVLSGLSDYRENY